MMSHRGLRVRSFRLLCVALAAALLAPPLFAQMGAGRFPNTELITQDGKKVHFYDDLLKGRIFVVAFIYTSCHYACPLETARLAQVQKKLGARVGSDIFFYSISIDPEHDTPRVLKAYKEKFHIGPGWTFLTGNKDDIVRLEKAIGMYSDPADNPDGHLPHLLIGNDATGQWLRGNALDNPDFQARMIGDFLDNFKHADLRHPQTNPGDGGPIANFDRGKYVFSRNCAPCHTIGHGDKIGPDLLGVTRVRDHQWLERMIQTPDELFKARDPIATALLKKYKRVRMPNVALNNDEFNALIHFLEAQSAAFDKSALANEHGTKSSSVGTAARPNP